jgi:hypothetical protein
MAWNGKGKLRSVGFVVTSAMGPVLSSTCRLENVPHWTVSSAELVSQLSEQIRLWSLVSELTPDGYSSDYRLFNDNRPLTFL